MRRSDIQHCTALIIVFFSLAYRAHAAVEITELHYNPQGANTNHQWVEVKNTGSSSVDLSTWFFATYEIDNAWHYHAITPDSSVSPTLAPGAYAVIASASATNIGVFKTDYPSFSGQLFRGSLNLSGTAGRIGMSADRTVQTSDVSYSSDMGASDDGNSLQLIGSAWVAAAPTPGIANGSSSAPTSPSPDPTPSSSAGTAAISSPVIPKKIKEPDVPTIRTEILTKTVAVAGIAFPMRSKTLGYANEEIVQGKFVWNFDDGEERVDTHVLPFEHVYQYPGEYAVTLSYYSYSYEDAPEATDRVVIKVIEPGVSISSLGNDADAYVELDNSSTYEAMLSKWTLKGSTHSFVIPEGTVLMAGKKLKFSPRITHFDAGDMSSVTLLYPTGESISVYPQIIHEPIIEAASTATARAPRSAYVPKASTAEASDEDGPIDLDSLSASAANSAASVSKSTLAWIGLGAVILVGLAGVLFVGKKNPPADDLEKELSAEDLTLLE